MSQHLTHVPKFGNWDSDENVPYTAVFDNAHTGKIVGGKMINPNDPEENPAAFGYSVPQSNNAAQQLPKNISGENGVRAAKPHHERRGSREDGESKNHMELPARSQYADSGARRTAGDLTGHRYSGHSTTADGSLIPNSGDSQRQGPHAKGENSVFERGSRQNPQGPDQSPLHHHYQGRLGNKPGAGSPSWERKASGEGGAAFAPATPGRSKLRGGNTRGDETPDRSAALPKFGEWNENDPASADGFTFIFNKAREEKQTGAAKIPTLPSDSGPYSSHKQPNVSNSKSLRCCCFAPRTRE